MRDIKFRAWDSLAEVWVENMTEQPLGFVLQPASHINIMQFTGLLDKNGKEIYEGDIVRKGLDLSKYNAPSDIQEVIYDAGCFVGKQQKGYGFVVFVLSAFLSEIEVIGNIYENSELLDETQTWRKQ